MAGAGEAEHPATGGDGGDQAGAVAGLGDVDEVAGGSERLDDLPGQTERETVGTGRTDGVSQTGQQPVRGSVSQTESGTGLLVVYVRELGQWSVLVAVVGSLMGVGPMVTVGR